MYRYASALNGSIIMSHSVQIRLVAILAFTAKLVRLFLEMLRRSIALIALGYSAMCIGIPEGKI